MAITTGNRYETNGIVWTLDEQNGPLGRTAKTVLGDIKLEPQERTDDEGNTTTELVEASWYDQPRTVTLYRAGKLVCTFRNLREYEAGQLAAAWVDQGE